MRAIVKAKDEVGLEMQDLPVPKVGRDEVLIRTLKSSICGTDVHIYQWDDWARRTIKPPLTIGHEFVGEVEAMGDCVYGVEKGMRVAGEGHITCGVCRRCREGKRHYCARTRGLGIHVPGCFADYFVLPAKNVFALPDDIDDDLAAIFDPFGNAVHTALYYDLLGETVLICGAGPIGVMATAIARHAGALYVVTTDVSDTRLALAKKMGAHRVVNVRNESLEEVMKDSPAENGFGVGLEVSGNPEALRSILRFIQFGGHIALLGIFPKEAEIDWDKVIFKSLTLKGIYGREIFGSWFRMVQLLQSGLDIRPVITDSLSANDFEEGFQRMIDGKSGKVILDWRL